MKEIQTSKIQMRVTQALKKMMATRANRLDISLGEYIRLLYLTNANEHGFLEEELDIAVCHLRDKFPKGKRAGTGGQGVFAGNKDEYILIRITDELKDKMNRTAKGYGLGLTEFLIFLFLARNHNNLGDLS